MPAAVEAGAEGVGLFRTEFLFLDDSKQAPSEEKQVAAYRAVLEAFPRDASWCGCWTPVRTSRSTS